MSTERFLSRATRPSLALALTLLVTAGCADDSTVTGLETAQPPAFSISPTGGDDTSCVALIAGQHTAAGLVCVGNDEEDLTVTYSADDGWTLVGSHLAVSADEPGNGEWLESGWQNRAGNPSPGRFPHGGRHGTGTVEVTYTIPLAGITRGVESGDLVYIAAHADVRQADGRPEGAWGAGERLAERGNWATVLEYAVVGGEEGPFAAITAGGLHTCALTSDGAAYCWGYGQFGQTGLGSTASRFQPEPVVGGHVFASISAGTWHTCGLDTDGRAYCWGMGSGGRLGTGETNDEFEPAPVSGDHTFSALAASTQHSCGVTSEGSVFCWGQGIGSQPTAVTNSPLMSSVSVGFGHRCGLDVGGQAHCWGQGGFGQLGRGSTSNSFSPSPVADGHVLSSVTAGGHHTCAVAVDGTGYCWGSNTRGQLGTGSTDRELRPAIVAGSHHFAVITASDRNPESHTCGLTTSGHAFCWGWGSEGRLGTGTMDDQTEPAAVAGNRRFESISAGDIHTCALTPNGAAFCWGQNSFGNLGTGSLARELEPAAVLTPES